MELSGELFALSFWWNASSMLGGVGEPEKCQKCAGKGSILPLYAVQEPKCCCQSWLMIS